ncbi:MAG: YsnF/AvaK domain-containing protein [Chloroflexota bacterium]
MNNQIVFDAEGKQGTLESMGTEQALLRLEDNRLVSVPCSMLVKQDDGSYRVAFSLKRFEQEGSIVIPVVEETLNVGKQEVVRGVRIVKTVRAEDIVVDEPLQREDIDVERVMVNRYVEDTQPVRYEGDTTIIPLIEEVLVVEKRLLLREEIHIKRQKKTVNNPQVYTLRREDMQVERDDETENL